jgi:TaqI-like C-terminal specificity domain
VLYLEDIARYRDAPEAVRTYLELPEHADKLKARAAYKRGDCEWWKYTWPLHKELHGQPRLISPYRTGHLRFALDKRHEYLTLTDTTVAFLRSDVQEDIRYVQAVLNSKLMTFRFRGLAKLTSPNMWEAFHVSIAELPIRRIDFSRETEGETHDLLVRLATQIEQAKNTAHHAPTTSARSLATRRVEGLTDELDDIVLDLYAITDLEERASIKALGSPL